MTPAELTSGSAAVCNSDHSVSRLPPARQAGDPAPTIRRYWCCSREERDDLRRRRGDRRRSRRDVHPRGSAGVPRRTNRGEARGGRGADPGGGGTARIAQLDALDEQAVDQHADDVAASVGGIDVSFNLISHGVVQGTPMAEMRLQGYLPPLPTAL